MKRMDRPIATIKRTKEIQEKYNVFTKKSAESRIALSAVIFVM